MGRKGKFELKSFRGDNMCYQLLTVINDKEKVKLRVLQITDSVSTMGHGYL